MTASRRVAIVGAALADGPRVDDQRSIDLVTQGVTRSIADAGLDKADVDGFGGIGGGPLPPIETTERLGMRPTWVATSTVGGSSWEFLAQHAVAAIRNGDADVIVLSYGQTARADLKARRRTANVPFNTDGAFQFDAPYGHTLISKYAMAARRHMHEFGTTIEQLAEIAVSARCNASLNPAAQYQDPISIDDVQSSRIIAEPFTKLHCCIRSDGGGGIVLASEERARDCAKQPVWVLGSGQTVSHTTMSEWEDFTVSPCVLSGRRAFQQAGVIVSDIDVCEFYDSFTYTVLLTLEGLGFCGRGEGGPFVADGRLRVGGDLPTNTDGGGLSACHPGMRGMFLLVEAVRQLRGECGLRQVSGARLACVNATGGWFSSTGTMILGAD
jgi:acetyl-CoA acetyltransferase